MSEIERYNGLTTADKGALLDAQKFGARWIARDWNNCIYGYYNRPNKTDTRVWSWTGLMHGMNEKSLEFVKWEDAEPVNIDIALAQIAEMESAEKPLPPTPLTWNERINQMTVEEKARWMLNRGTEMHNESAKYARDNASHKLEEMYIKRMTDFLNNPYTEGETDED